MDNNVGSSPNTSGITPFGLADNKGPEANNINAIVNTQIQEHKMTYTNNTTTSTSEAWNPSPLPPKIHNTGKGSMLNEIGKNTKKARKAGDGYQVDSGTAKMIPTKNEKTKATEETGGYQVDSGTAKMIPTKNEKSKATEETGGYQVDSGTAKMIPTKNEKSKATEETGGYQVDSGTAKMIPTKNEKSKATQKTGGYQVDSGTAEVSTKTKKTTRNDKSRHYENPVEVQKEKIRGVFNRSANKRKFASLEKKMTVGGDRELLKNFHKITKQEDLKDLEFNIVGSGAAKTVLVPQIKKTNNFAVSVFNLEKDESKKELPQAKKKSRMHEYEMTNTIGSLKLPNVVTCGTLLSKRENVYFLSRFCNKGTIDNAWNNATPEQKLKYLVDAAKGEQALHNAGIVHKDCHGGNILVNDDTAFVADFGISIDTKKVDAGDNYKLVAQNRGVLPPKNTSLSNNLKLLKNKYEDLEKSAKKLEGDERKVALQEMNKLVDEINPLITQIRNLELDPKNDSYAFALEICRLARKGREGLDFPPKYDDNSTFSFINWNDDTDPVAAQEKVIEFINKSFPEEGELKNLVMRQMSFEPSDRLGDAEFIKALENLSPNEIEKIWPR